jgi:hypothetical protein
MAVADLTFASGASQALDSTGNAAISLQNIRHVGMIFTSTAALVGTTIVLQAACRSTETHYDLYTSTGAQVTVTNAAIDRAIGLNEASMQVLRDFGSFTVNSTAVQGQAVTCKVYLKG